MIVALLDRSRSNDGDWSFSAVLASKPFSDRKRAFWRIAVLPNRVIPTRVPTSGPTASECRPISPHAGAKSQRLIPT
jgi:hypothetical protein